MFKSFVICDHDAFTYNGTSSYDDDKMNKEKAAIMQLFLYS